MASSASVKRVGRGPGAELLVRPVHDPQHVVHDHAVGDALELLQAVLRELARHPRLDGGLAAAGLQLGQDRHPLLRLGDVVRVSPLGAVV
jgi:hypothetical protein